MAAVLCLMPVCNILVLRRLCKDQLLQGKRHKANNCVVGYGCKQLPVLSIEIIKLILMLICNMLKGTVSLFSYRQNNKCIKKSNYETNITSFWYNLKFTQKSDCSVLESRNLLSEEKDMFNYRHSPFNT